MAPRTRSSGAPPTGHRQLDNEAPKTPSKRPREEDDDNSESDRDLKRPHTEPRRGLPIFQRNQSYIARNRAKWHQKAQTARGPRFIDVTQAPMLQPEAREQAGITVRQSIEQDEEPERSDDRPDNRPDNRPSTLSWLMSIPGRLFSPAPRRAAETPPAPRDRSTSPTPANRQVVRLPSPQDNPHDLFTAEAPPNPTATVLYKKRRVERGSHNSPMIETEEPELMTEQVEGSSKRKVARNTFALSYSDEEDFESAQNGAVTATITKVQTPSKSPLKSALRSTIGSATGKRLRINETPTKVKKLYGHYGPAGEYRGSTFADKTYNSFSTIESSARSRTTDESSIPDDADTVRRLAVTAEARHNTFRNNLPTSNDRPHTPNIFSSSAKPFVQPNSFQVPDDDDEDEEDDIIPLHDTDGEAAAPPTPRMSHADLPESPQPVEDGETAQEASARKESEEAALRKLREQAQKYKPKTSSRLSTVEEKSRSRSSSPPASMAAEDIINREEQLQGHQSGEGPYAAPYTWTKPARPSYSSQDPHYEPIVFDNTRVDSDGMTDKERRAARDAAADAWVAENVKWPEPLTYVDAGLCSPYIDRLMTTEICEEGRQRADEFYEKQFEEAMKWAYVEKAKGNQCALTWDNGRQEMVW